ncbi:hypothetical protein L598_005000000120 [Mesorhizobium sp. J18]|uniref:hypothetical protein n=1 Tax=Mesorhizobium sp. J18 TaxID=935263 RepID=UPI00119ADD73|nr:hypothetical protein [Mesorhizobium sp. J18]TWG92111.1 hypothetical protein L598_005000000120 [Mesorhizobium sp. J18]
MFDKTGHIKALFRRVNRAVQIGFASLFLAIGGLLLMVLVLQSPGLLKGLCSGDSQSLESIISGLAGVGLCWLQWRYRHVVYPQLRREFLAGRNAR